MADNKPQNPILAFPPGLPALNPKLRKTIRIKSVMPVSRVLSWTVPEIPHLECFRAFGFVHEYPRHSHSTWAIGVVNEGTAGIWHRGTNELVGPGGVIAVNPGAVHTGYPLQKSGVSHSMLYLGDELVTEVLPGIADLPAFPQTTILDPDLAARLRSTCRSLELGGPYLAIETKLLSDLSCLFIRHARVSVREQTGSEPGHVVRIQEYLRANLRRNVALTELVQLTELSKAYLIRSFRRAVGIPPYEWLLQLRIEEARQRLQNGDRICDVAIELGFSDQSHFHRRFKRLTGITPSLYAEGHYRSRQRNAPPRQ
jgi:AraC-like DNA-binding protein